MLEVLGDVGQMKKIAERARDQVGLIPLQLAHPVQEQLVVLGTALAPQPHSRSAQGLYGVESGFALGLTNHIPKHPAQ